MEEFLCIIANEWNNEAYGAVEAPISHMIEDSVVKVCGFFQIEQPAIVETNHTTTVNFRGNIACVNDMQFFNRVQLEDMGITGQDSLDLVMTHEGTHRILQEMDMGLNSHQEELCCDYMAGIRAGLNGMDASQLIDALGNTTESETLPEGFFRVAAMQRGIEFAKQFQQQHPLTFSECLEEFKSGSMRDILELEHLKNEMYSHECNMHHYHKALESEHGNEELMHQFHKSESQYVSAKNAFDNKYSEMATRNFFPNKNYDTNGFIEANKFNEDSKSMSENYDTLHEFSSDVSSASVKVESCQQKVNSLHSKLNSVKSKYGTNSEEYRHIKSEYDKAQRDLNNARNDYQKAVQYAHRSGTL